MDTFRTNRQFIALAVFCALALLISLVAQAIFKHQPCLLCNLQRWAFVVIGGSSFLGYLSKQKTTISSFLCLVLFASVLIAGYHTLIQFGLLRDFCIKHSPLSQNAFDSILSASTNASSGCSSKTWTLAGLPISFYNFVFFGAILLCMPKNIRKNP